MAIKTELDLLKSKADLLGISYSNNIGVTTLRERIKEATKEDKTSVSTASEDDEVPTKQSIRQRLKKEEMKLVRIRLACLNPHKKDLQGEIFTVANRYLGTVRKFVPYGEATNNGYHVPNCIYKRLKSAKFCQVNIRKSKATGQDVITRKWVPEYSIEVLPQLTIQELEDLKAAQLGSYID